MQKINRRHTCATSIAAALIGALLLVGTSHAAGGSQESIVDFSIPAQPLSTALIEFSKQANIQILTAGYEVEGIGAADVIGRLTLDGALSRMLEGSGFNYQFLDGKTLILVKDGGRGGKTIALGAAMQLAQESADIKGPDADAAHAAPADDLDPKAKTKQTEVETIVVTAQKREQRVIDIPMSISVLGAQELERKGIETMVDLSYAAPGMMVQEFGPGRQVIYMRGVGNRVGDSAVTGVYLDEVPVTVGNSGPGSIGQLDLRTTDLERVEVLKGPQGTLYGAGAVSGTVRFITANPQLDGFSAKGDLTASFTEDGDPSQRVSAVLNMPVVHNVFGLRAAATVENNGGWIDRPDAGRSDVNGNDLTNVRLKGLWQPSDTITVQAMAIVNRNEDPDSGGINHSDPDGTYRMAVDPARAIPFYDDYDLYNLTATFDFGPVTLLTSSSYIDHDASFAYAYSSGPETLFFGFDSLSIFDSSSEAFSQEVRLVSSDQNALKWTVGAFYQDVEEQGRGETESVFFGSTFPSSSSGASGSTSWAAFGDVAYELTEKFEVGLGVRYFEDERTTISVSGLVAEKREATFDKATWRATASYDLKDNFKAYLNVSTGFRSGGFNTVGIPPYEPETLLQYEIGSKAVLNDGKTRVDFALFYSDYKDYLRRGLIFNPIDTTFAQSIGNVGDVTIKGAELSVDAAITDRFSVRAGGSYTDAELSSLDTSRLGTGLNPGVGLVGDPVDYIPEFSYVLGGEYRFDWAPNVPGFLQVDYNYRDKVTVIDRSIMTSAMPIMYSDNISLLNARLGLARDRWSVHLFGENLLNENGSFDPWVVWAQAVRNRPRTYGVKVGLEF